MLSHQGSSILRLFTLMFALVAGLAMALGTMLSAVYAAPLAAPLGGLKQFRLPPDNSQPRHVAKKVPKDHLIPCCVQKYFKWRT